MWVYVFPAAAAVALLFVLHRRRRWRRTLSDRPSLAGKTVVVTGGGSGLGACLAERLAVREKADVFVWDVDERGMASVKARIEERGGRVGTFAVDVANGAQVAELVRLMEVKGQAIDVLISNAGVAVLRSVAQVTDADVRRR